MRVHHQAAYVLLNRPYSESSWITELFTRDHGRLAVIAKGARRQKSPFRGALLPFQPLLVSWTGKGEVPTLTGAELQANKINLLEQELVGDALICGFYCNELISYLLHRYDPHPALYDGFADTLLRLAKHSAADLPGELRRFEQQVVRETGYELNFEFEAGSKALIDPAGTYIYAPGEGFQRCAPAHKNAIPGRVIASLRSGSITGLSGAEISLSKQVMRAILRQSLGHRNINSRDLFVRAVANEGSNISFESKLALSDL